MKYTIKLPSESICNKKYMAECDTITSQNYMTIDASVNLDEKIIPFYNLCIHTVGFHVLPF